MGPPGFVVDLGVAGVAQRQAAFRLVAGAHVMRHGGPSTTALAVPEGAGEDELAEPHSERRSRDPATTRHWGPGPCSGQGVRCGQPGVEQTCVRRLRGRNGTDPSASWTVASTGSLAGMPSRNVPDGTSRNYRRRYAAVSDAGAILARRGTLARRCVATRPMRKFDLPVCREVQRCKRFSCLRKYLQRPSRCASSRSMSSAVAWRRSTRSSKACWCARSVITSCSSSLTASGSPGSPRAGASTYPSSLRAAR
jgi:hypothetical protein